MGHGEETSVTHGKNGCSYATCLEFDEFSVGHLALSSVAIQLSRAIEDVLPAAMRVWSRHQSEVLSRGVRVPEEIV